MKKIRKIFSVLFITLMMLIGQFTPVLAANSKGKGSYIVQTTVYGENSSDSQGVSSSYDIDSSTRYSTLYSQSKWANNSEKPFTVESQYLKGMTEEEQEEYYKSLNVAIYEDTHVKMQDAKWERVEDPVIKIINEINDNKIDYIEGVKQTLALSNENKDIDKIKSELVTTMFNNYPSLLESKKLEKDDVNLDEYSVLDKILDLVIYDNNGKTVHGSNVTVTITNSLITDQINANELFVLHYNTTNKEWELLPTFNVDTSTNTTQCTFPNLSPFTLVYKTAEQNEDGNNNNASDKMDSHQCDEWYCTFFRNKCCRILCNDSRCLCWILIIILILVILILFAIIGKISNDKSKDRLELDDDDDDFAGIAFDDDDE